ncbi:unnamed protein product [Lactuca virosa]|uniref:Uncharacterized protein n=1 Tax=Lactuca virosa TaxID=75947 RepID=A0AAU9P1Y6_9ASTR|nr:unnamed protein product [Lactuca virosa]
MWYGIEKGWWSPLFFYVSPVFLLPPPNISLSFLSLWDSKVTTCSYFLLYHFTSSSQNPSLIVVAFLHCRPNQILLLFHHQHIRYYFSTHARTNMKLSLERRMVDIKP